MIRVRIVEDDLTGAAIAALLEEHLADMVVTTPDPESRHALDLAGLRVPEITFWSVWDGEELVGAPALVEQGLQLSADVAAGVGAPDEAVGEQRPGDEALQPVVGAEARDECCA